MRLTSIIHPRRADRTDQTPDVYVGAMALHDRRETDRKTAARTAKEQSR